MKKLTEKLILEEPIDEIEVEENNELEIPEAELEQPIQVNDIPEEVVDNAYGNLISNTISREWDDINSYKDLVAQFVSEQKYPEVVDILNQLIDDKTINVGMLTKALELINGTEQNDLMQQGIDKAEEVISDNRDLAKEVAEENLKENYFIIDIDDEKSQGLDKAKFGDYVDFLGATEVAKKYALKHKANVEVVDDKYNVLAQFLYKDLIKESLKESEDPRVKELKRIIKKLEGTDLTDAQRDSLEKQRDILRDKLDKAGIDYNLDESLKESNTNITIDIITAEMNQKEKDIYFGSVKQYNIKSTPKSKSIITISGNKEDVYNWLIDCGLKDKDYFKDEEIYNDFIEWIKSRKNESLKEDIQTYGYIIKDKSTDEVVEENDRFTSKDDAYDKAVIRYKTLLDENPGKDYEIEITDETIDTDFDESYDAFDDDNEYIYQFPKDANLKYIQQNIGLSPCNIKVIGRVNKKGDNPGDILLQGTKADLEKFLDDYFDYEINDDYLYELDEFDTELISPISKKELKFEEGLNGTIDLYTLPEEYQQQLEQEMNNLGWILDDETTKYGSKRFYKPLWGDPDDEAQDIHYQFITKDKLSEEQYDELMDKTYDLLDELEEEFNSRITFSSALCTDDRATIGIDCRAIEYKKGESDTKPLPLPGSKVRLKDGKPSNEYSKKVIDDIEKHGFDTSMMGVKKDESLKEGIGILNKEMPKKDRQSLINWWEDINITIYNETIDTSNLEQVIDNEEICEDWWVAMYDVLQDLKDKLDILDKESDEYNEVERLYKEGKKLYSKYEYKPYPKY